MSRETYRILVLQAAESAYLLTRKLLESATLAHYQIDWEKTAEAADIRLFERTSNYDLLLIDSALTTTHTGLNLFRKLKEKDVNLPIVVLETDSVVAKDATAELILLGIVDFISQNTLTAALLDRSICYSIERKRNERLIDRYQRETSSMLKMVALGEMAGAISHEINNPLAVIQVRALAALELLSPRNTLQGGERDQKLQAQAEGIIAMVDRITDIKSGLQYYYGSMTETAFQEVQAGPLVHESIKLVQDRLTKSKIRLELPRIESTALQCRPTDISQVIVNLLNNACDAVENESEKWIRIESVIGLSTIQITFTDSSSPQVDLYDEIFKKGYSKKKRGMGLGLALSRKIIESHSGTLAYERVGPRNQFTVILPKAFKATKPDSYHFLVVDDELGILEILSDEISKNGHRVISESNPTSAKDRAINGDFDAIICDIHMPSMSGIDLAQGILNDTPEGSKKPIIIFMSGKATALDKNAISADQTQPTYFFEKPFQIEELIQTAINAIQKQ